ncbi:YdaS family helix-turn-helix protein [Burkholderia gladioli]|uniref:YdaS family helix-turn-helix protein n=1 Tax=Burkholderia gladioli TaxID=28095 RepID=UPI001FC7DA87|nr:YdaS family helix-turn-helix protein [Burkholderia gladioli]
MPYMTGSTVTFVKELVAAAGGATAVARALGLSRGSVNEWTKKGRVPNPRVLPLAELTGWKFTPHMIAPALYPNATDGLPQKCQV